MEPKANDLGPYYVLQVTLPWALPSLFKIKDEPRLILANFYDNVTNASLIMHIYREK